MTESTLTVEQFEAALPVGEVLPLAVIRRALYQWHVAHWRAEEAAQQVTGFPEDARLARCVQYLRHEVETFAAIAARAVQAWAGDQSGPVFISYFEGEATVVRVDPGEEHRLRVVRPGDPLLPADAEVFDLSEAEKELIRRAVIALEPDPEWQACCIAKIASWRQLAGSIGDALGHGGFTPGRFASMIHWMSYMELKDERERAAKEARHDALRERVRDVSEQ